MANIFEDFEGGLSSSWTLLDADCELKTDFVYAGTNSIGIQSGNALEDVAIFVPPELQGGLQINSIEFYWLEQSSSNGGGLQLKDSDGNLVVGFATDNPQWEFVDGSGTGTTVYSGSGYEKWVKVQLAFDWTASTFDYYIEDLGNGTIREGTRNLLNNTNVETIVLSNYSGSSFDSGTNIYMWFDNITLEIPELVENDFDSNLFVTYREDLSCSINVYSDNVEVYQETEENLFPIMISNTTPAPTSVIYSSEYSTTYEAWQAFNRTAEDTYDAWLSDSGDMPCYVGMELEGLYIPASYKIKNRNGNYYDTSAPNTFKLQGSNDGVNWITLDRRENKTNWTQAEIREYEVTESTKLFKHFRLYIEENNGRSWTAVSQFELYGKEFFRGSQRKSNLFVLYREELTSDIWINPSNVFSTAVDIVPIYLEDFPSYLNIKKISNLTSSIGVNPTNKFTALVDIVPPPTFFEKLEPVADAFVRENERRLNYGIEQDLLVGYSEAKDEHYRTFLDFNVKEFLPNEALVLEAKLVLDSMLSADNEPLEIVIKEAKKEWTENGVTWLNQPDSEETILAETIIDSETQAIDFNNTDLVKGWDEGVSEEYGFVIEAKDETTATTLKRFYSRESANPPQLLLTYTYDIVYNLRQIDLDSTIAVRTSKKTDLTSILSIDNNWNFADLRGYIKLAFQIDCSIIVENPNLECSIQPVYNSMLDSSILPRVWGLNEGFSGYIETRLSSLVSNIYKPYTNDLNDCSLTARQNKVTEIECNTFINTPVLYSTIQPKQHEDLSSSITAKPYGDIDLSSNIISRQDNLSDLISNIFVVGASHLTSSMYLNSGYFKSSIYILFQGTSGIFSKIAVRVKRKSDLELDNFDVRSGGIVQCSIIPRLHSSIKCKIEAEPALIADFAGHIKVVRYKNPFNLPYYNWHPTHDFVRLGHRYGYNYLFCNINQVRERRVLSTTNYPDLPCSITSDFASKLSSSILVAQNRFRDLNTAITVGNSDVWSLQVPGQIASHLEGSIEIVPKIKVLPFADLNCRIGVDVEEIKDLLILIKVDRFKTLSEGFSTPDLWTTITVGHYKFLNCILNIRIFSGCMLPSNVLITVTEVIDPNNKQSNVINPLPGLNKQYDKTKEQYNVKAVPNEHTRIFGGVYNGSV